MNEFLSPHARSVLLGDADARRCTATNRDGTRCGRASALGQFVCDKHGAKAPLSIRTGKERLALLVEPALDALFRALKSAPPCALCGRSDSDRDPTVVAAARVVLDRAGYHPTLTIEHVESDPYADLDINDTITMLERLLEQARALRDAEPPCIDAAAIPDDDVALVDAMVEDTRSCPVGDQTIPAETPEKPKENGDE
jgi:hypothetical protein